MPQISIFYLINWIFSAETIQGGKLYEEIRYYLNYLEESLTIYCFHDIGVLMKGMVKSGAWIQKRRSTFFVKIWDCDIVVILAKFFDLSLAHFFDIYNFLWNTLLNPAPSANLIFFISKIYFWMWRMKLNLGDVHKLRLQDEVGR